MREKLVVMRERLDTRDKLYAEELRVSVYLADFLLCVRAAHVSEALLVVHFQTVLHVEFQIVVAEQREVDDITFDGGDVHHRVARAVDHDARTLYYGIVFGKRRADEQFFQRGEKGVARRIFYRRFIPVSHEFPPLLAHAQPLDFRIPAEVYELRGFRERLSDTFVLNIEFHSQPLSVRTRRPTAGGAANFNL